MNKTIIGGIAVVVLIAVGVIFYTAPHKPATPPAQAGQKINIDVVCIKAIARMTFAEGSSSSVFLQECKDGKHPEVIEAYKAHLQLDGAVI